MVAAVSLADLPIAISIGSQSLTFLKACLLGAALGLFYDLFRIMRRMVTLPYSFVAAQDLLYIFCSVFFSFVFFMQTTDGRLRWFIIVGELLGMAVYHLTIGSFIMWLAMKIIAFVKGLLNTAWRLFIAPVIELMEEKYKRIKKTTQIQQQKIKKTLVNRKKRLKQKGKLLYNSSVSAIKAQERRLKQMMARGMGNGKEKT